MGLKTSLKSMNAGVLSAVHRGPARLVNQGVGHLQRGRFAVRTEREAG